MVWTRTGPLSLCFALHKFSWIFCQSILTAAFRKEKTANQVTFEKSHQVKKWSNNMPWCLCYKDGRRIEPPFRPLFFESWSLCRNSESSHSIRSKLTPEITLSWFESQCGSGFFYWMSLDPISSHKCSLRMIFRASQTIKIHQGFSVLPNFISSIELSKSFTTIECRQRLLKTLKFQIT